MGTTDETLTRPIIQAQELPVEPSIEANLRTYEYTHADGTVHHAENAETARAACPVLGKMAVEQADLLLEVAAIGQQKMKEEQVKEQPRQPEPEKIKPQQEAARKAEKTKQPEPNQTTTQEAAGQFVQTEKPLPLATLEATEKKIVIWEQIKPDDPKQKEMVLEPYIVIAGTEKGRHVEQLSGEVYRQYAVGQDDQNELPVILESHTEQIPDVQPSELVVERFIPEQVITLPNTIIETVEQTLDTIKAKSVAAFSFNETVTKTDEAMVLETMVEQSDEQPLSVAEIAETHTVNEPEFPTVVKIEADRRLELHFEPEVIDTYKELLALIKGEATILIPNPSKTSDNINEPDDDAGALAVETVVLDTAEQKTDFEKVIALKIETEEVIPLEAIVEQADEQPLEQTLVQLAQYLTVALQEKSKPLDNADTAEQPIEIAPEQGEQLNEFRHILQDIAEVLPRSYYIDEETGEQHIKITPELTEQLLLLLAWVGYEHPREVLVEFVRVHGLTYLLQALQYMYQLIDVDERKELFVAATATTPSSDNTSVGSLLGNAVLRLLAIRTFANEY